MAHHCRRMVVLAPWRRLLFQPCHTTPGRHFWNLSRPTDFRSLIRDMDRTMERLEKEFIDNFPFRGLVPRMIPIQGGQKHSDIYQLNIDVDGFKPEEINLSLKDNILKIHAKMERKAEDGSKYQQEFTREMTIPDDVDPAELKSFLGNDGVLRLEATYKPKPEEKPKEIPVARD